MKCLAVLFALASLVLAFPIAAPALDYDTSIAERVVLAGLDYSTLSDFERGYIEAYDATVKDFCRGVDNLEAGVDYSSKEFVIVVAGNAADALPYFKESAQYEGFSFVPQNDFGVIEAFDRILVNVPEGHTVMESIELFLRDSHVVAANPDYYYFAEDDTDKRFSDVDMKQWYVEEGYINYVLLNGLMQGYEDVGLFRPTQESTRAEFVTSIYRMANPGSDATTNSAHYQTNQAGFTDLPDNKYYTAAFNWAKTAGIIMGDSGTGYTTVRPNDSLTRQEAAAILQRFASYEGVNTSTTGMATPSLGDWNTIASWAKDAMLWCYHRNVIAGWNNGDGTYSALPKRAVDRSMQTKMMTIMHRDIL